MARKAVFLDRDGTIIEDREYLGTPSGVAMLAGVELAIKSLKQAGYVLVVVSNQSGVARGMFTAEDVQLVNAELQRQLEQRGAGLDAYYFCPYHPEGRVPEYAQESDLRKPKPGMLLQAAEDLDIDLSASWMVGDSARDVEAGRAAGCRTVWVRTGKDQSAEGLEADHLARNLVEAARLIMRSEKSVGTQGAADASEKTGPAVSSGIVAMAMSRNGKGSRPAAEEASDYQADAPQRPQEADNRQAAHVGPGPKPAQVEGHSPGGQAPPEPVNQAQPPQGPGEQPKAPVPSPESEQARVDETPLPSAPEGDEPDTSTPTARVWPDADEDETGAAPQRQREKTQESTKALAKPFPAPRGKGRGQPHKTSDEQNPAPAAGAEGFSVTKLVAGVAQMLAVLAVLVVVVRGAGGAAINGTMVWAMLSVTFQTMSLTFYLMQRMK